MYADLQIAKGQGGMQYCESRRLVKSFSSLLLPAVVQTMLRKSLSRDMEDSADFCWREREREKSLLYKLPSDCTPLDFPLCKKPLELPYTVHLSYF